MKELVIVSPGYGWQSAPRGVETWGITKIILWRQDIDILWDVHDLEEPGREMAKSRMALATMPVMVTKTYDWLPTGVAYPLKDIINEFKTDYFADSVCYAIAYAIWLKYTKIDFYGTNMAGVDELVNERPCVEYWLGRANERGIQTVIHGSKSPLLRTHNLKLYGYGTEQTQIGELNTSNEEDLWQACNSLEKLIGTK